jgi:hypothetical protein
MQTNIEHQDRQPIAESADEMLTNIRRELVGIHAAIDARTHDDKEIVPWTKRELLGLIRDIRSFQKEHRARTVE